MTSKLLFNLFGITCKFVFHILALIFAYKVNVYCMLILIGVWLLHNSVHYIWLKVDKNILNSIINRR